MTDKQIIITNKRQGKNIYNIIDNKTELTIQSKKFGDITFIVDTNLIDLLKEYPWCVRNFKGNYYAYANKDNNKNIALHRLITKCPKGLIIDHLNHNTLDNRLENLKICTNKENCQARRYDYRLTLYFNNYHQHYVARYQAKDKMYERASKNKDLAISNLKKLLKENNIVISEVENED